MFGLLWKAQLTLWRFLTVLFGYATTVIPRVYTYYVSTALFAIFGIRMLREGLKMSPDEGQEELEEVQAELKKKDEEVSCRWCTPKASEGKGPGMDFSGHVCLCGLARLVSTLTITRLWFRVTVNVPGREMCAKRSELFRLTARSGWWELLALHVLKHVHAVWFCSGVGKLAL